MIVVFTNICPIFYSFYPDEAKCELAFSRALDLNKEDDVAVVLEPERASNSSNVSTEMKRYFIKSNQYSMIGHLQKFIATKILNGAIDFEKVKFT